MVVHMHWTTQNSIVPYQVTAVIELMKIPPKVLYDKSVSYEIPDYKIFMRLICLIDRKSHCSVN